MMTAQPAKMARTCSQCGNNGHNARTCTDHITLNTATNNININNYINNNNNNNNVNNISNQGVMLFGVNLANSVIENSTSPRSIDSSSSSTTTSMRKCMSMNNLAQYEQQQQQQQQFRQRDTQDSGFASDDGIHASATHNRERKRGIPWTEDEHKLFLVGLNQVGKGDWRGISRNFVKTRSPTQVASHAQKYFLRRTNLNRRRRRSSLFDITADTMTRSASADQLNNLDTTFQPNQATNKPTLFSSPRPPTLQPISTKHARTVVSVPPSIKMAKLNLNESPPISSPTSSTSTNETREREFEPFLSLQIPQAPSDDDSSRSSNFRGFSGNGDNIISVA